jgi:predicted transposase/invertase (TIGR01784 family)
LLNASKAYVKQLDISEEFKLLQPVYSLNFVNDTFEKSPEMRNEYYHHYRIVNIKDTNRQIESLEFVFIELPKFKPQNRAERKLQELWLRFLTEINEATREAPKELLENDYTREAVSYMEAGAYTKEQLEVYDKFRDAIMTERSLIGDALRKGETEGEAKGRAKEQKKMILNSHRAGLSLETISTITGLTSEEIKKIITEGKR